MKRGTWGFVIGALATCVVLGAVIAGVVLLESPREARLRRFDERRVEDLRTLAFAVDAYWSREGRLPDSLSDLAETQGIPEGLVDPETSEAYEYRVIGERTFELCAVFAREARTGARNALFRSRWDHDKGRAWFRLEAQDQDASIDW